MGLLFLVHPLHAAAASGKKVLTGDPGKSTLALPFISNSGQVDDRVAYYSINTSGKTFVTREGDIVYVPGGGQGEGVIREHFAGGRRSAVRGGASADLRVNYYLGADPSKWREDLGTFQWVDLGEKYDCIEVRLAAGRRGVEKVFTVRPGGDPSRIRGRIDGARSLAVAGGGDLAVSLSTGKVFFTRPVAYQIKDGERLDVEVSYLVRGREYRFTLGPYDETLPLVIDPLLSSSYLGGSSNETTYAVGVSGGDVIVAGSADSVDFPGLDEKIDVLGDAFVVRLDPDLSTVRAATYFGGSMTDGIRDMAVDGDTIYVAGFNNSPNFPSTPGAAYSGTSLSGSFVARLDAGTLRIKAATSFHANVFGLAWSPGGREVFVAGSTGRTDFAIPSGAAPPFQASHMGGADSFIAAFDEDLTTLKTATFLGGEGFDIIYSLTVDEAGFPIAAGVTNSAAFPVKETAFDPTYNLNWEATHQWIDGFVARLSPDLSSLEGATYVGGGWNDYITAVLADGGDILVGGNTSSADFPCASTFGPIDGNDAFVARMDRDLTRMKSCSVFGGSRTGTGSSESVSGLAVHPSGSIFVTGRTNASNFPTTPGAFLSRPPGSYFGAFIIALQRDLSGVEASTLVHGGSEDLKALAVDSWGDVIVAGDSSGGGYPVTPGALQSDHAGGDDLVISRFTPDLTGAHIEVVPEAIQFGHLPAGMEAVEKIIVHNRGGAELTIGDLSMAAGSSSVFEIDDQCFIISAYGSCPIEVTFRPVSPGVEKGQLTIGSSDPFHPRVTVDLEGTAIAVPAVQVSEKTLFFGDVNPGTASVAKDLFVGNTGVSDLDVQEIRIVGLDAGEYLLVSEDCSARPMGPGQTCRITARFVPSDKGESLARLEILTNDPLNPVFPVTLSGRGVVSPRIEAQPDPCDFGKVKAGSTVSRVVRIYNAGGADLTVDGVALEGERGGLFSIEEETCAGRILKPRQEDGEVEMSCEVVVLFAPVSVKRAEGSLLLTSNDPGAPVSMVPLSGTGVEPEEVMYPGFWGWVAILVLVLRMVAGLPVSASGWGKWMKKKGKDKGERETRNQV